MYLPTDFYLKIPECVMQNSYPMETKTLTTQSKKSFVYNNVYILNTLLDNKSLLTINVNCGIRIISK